MSLPSAAGAQPAPLTSDNLRRLGPSLIQPMPPVSISSSGGDNKDAKDTPDDEHQEAKILRLRTWIYNAMQTLVGLGAAGLKILEQDELIISGLGQIGLRPHLASDVDINNVAYLEGKLAYLVAKCKPLSQECRRRRRVATREEAIAEDEARALAETKAIEGDGSGNMRAGDGPGAGPRPHQDIRYRNSAYPTVFPIGLHGGTQDDGKSYYYETLRRYLRNFLSDAEAEALLKEKAYCDAASRRESNHLRSAAILADTASMACQLRGGYLKMQGMYIIGKMKLHSHTPVFQAIEKATLRDFPCPFSFYIHVPPSELFDLWASLRLLPRAHVLHTQYNYVRDPKGDDDAPYPKEYLDLVEAKQGAMFRFWLAVAPGQVRTALQASTPQEQVYVCRLLGAALLDESQALRAMNALSSNRCTAWSMQAMQATITTSRAPTALDTLVEKWLDGLPPLPESLDGAAVYMPMLPVTNEREPAAVSIARAEAALADARARLSARAAGTPQGPPVGPASPGSACSLEEISQEEFIRKQRSGLNPLAPEYIAQAHAYQRGGEMDELDVLDELDEPEMPPAKRNKCLHPQGGPSLQHDQSVHRPPEAVKTEQTTDAPTPLAAVYTSATATPQSSASSAPTLDAVRTEDREEEKGKGKGKEKEKEKGRVKGKEKEERVIEMSATGMSILGKRPLQSS